MMLHLDSVEPFFEDVLGARTILSGLRWSKVPLRTSYGTQSQGSGSQLKKPKQMSKLAIEMAIPKRLRSHVDAHQRFARE